eukprot:6095843-Prymnesium_polylepis.2
MSRIGIGSFAGGSVARPVATDVFAKPKTSSSGISAGRSVARNSRMYVAIARAVGWSIAIVGGNEGSPLSARILLTRSVAASESTPISVKGVSAPASGEAPAPVTSRSVLSTIAST